MIRRLRMVYELELAKGRYDELKEYLKISEY